MERNFYKTCFQIVQSLFELKLITSQEKCTLKQQIINNEVEFVNLTSENISAMFLQNIHRSRHQSLKMIKQSHILNMIDEETDEEII